MKMVKKGKGRLQPLQYCALSAGGQKAVEKFNKSHGGTSSQDTTNSIGTYFYSPTSLMKTTIMFLLQEKLGVLPIHIIHQIQGGS